MVVGKLPGPAQLGAYQMSSRLVQMLLADAAIAMSQYLFPTFAERHCADPHAAAWLFKRYIGVITLRLAAQPLFSLVLGPAWLPAVLLFTIFVINMAISVLIAVLVAYLRAVGDAKATMQAPAIDVVVLLVCVPLATYDWGVTGIAWSITVGLSFATAWMLYRTARCCDRDTFAM